MAQKVSALQIGACLDLSSRASGAPTQVWCLKGVEGVLVGDVNKKPEVRRRRSPYRAEVMLEAEGLGDGE